MTDLKHQQAERGMIKFLTFWIGVILYSRALVSLWAWFIAAKFNLPQFNWPEMFGFILTVRAITGRREPVAEKKDDDDWLKDVLIDLTLPLLLWMTGWAIKHFLM